MIRRVTFLAVLTAILLSCPVFAGDDGGTESVFNLGAGARAMAMGNGYVALAQDATAVYYNPAGMPYLSSQEITFLHTVLFESTVYDFVSYVYPHSAMGGFGIAGMRIGTDDIGRRDEITDLGRFSASRMQLLLSYGRRIGNRISSGVNLKLVHQAIDEYSAYGYGIDLAGRVSITEKLRAGILIQDIVGARMKLMTARERTPVTLRGGLAYSIDPKDSPFSATAVFDLEKPEDRSVKLRTGLEMAHSSGLALRAGYDRDNFTLGMGLRYHQLTFDYGYKFMERLTDSHRFSLSFSFGSTEDERQARRLETARKDQELYLQADRRASLQRELAQADRYYNEGQLDSALAGYYRADAFADDFADDETQNYISERIAGILLQQAEERPGEIVAEDRIEEIIRQATDLMNKGALKAARDIVDAAISLKLDSPELFVLRREIAFRIETSIKSLLVGAEQAFDQGNYIEAYNQYNQVLALNAGSLPARNGSEAAKIQIKIAQHLKLAMDYYDQERYILSQREFNAVLQLEPGNETARWFLRRIDDELVESGTQAEKDLRQDSEMWQIYLDGVEAYRIGDFKKAIELWDKVLEKYPNDKMTIENRRQAELRIRD